VREREVKLKRHYDDDIHDGGHDWRELQSSPLPLHSTPVAVVAHTNIYLLVSLSFSVGTREGYEKCLFVYLFASDIWLLILKMDDVLLAEIRRKKQELQEKQVMVYTFSDYLTHKQTQTNVWTKA